MSEGKKYKATICLVCFISGSGTVAFSFVMSSLWPYMKKLDPTVTETVLGWITSVFSIAQLISSLVFGYWVDRRRSLEPLVASLVVLIIASGMYVYAESFGRKGIWILFAARAMMGIFLGSVTILRVVMAKISTPATLAVNMSYIGVSQSIGFFFGPGIQTLSIFAGSKGLYIPSIRLRLDYYTFPGYLFIVIGITTIILLYFYFDDGDEVSEKHGDYEKITGPEKLKSKDGKSYASPDSVAVSICLVLFLFSMASLAISETISAPIIMAESGYTRRKTVYIGGSILASCGVIALFFIILSVRLAKRFSDKKVILAGLIIIFIGHVFFLPMGPGYPKVAVAKVATINRTLVKFHSLIAAEITGCPHEYNWCLTDPKLALPQFIAGLLLVYIGYSLSYVVMVVLYTKVIGPSSQGKYMGWLAFAGGTARILGPVYVTILFKSYGLRWMVIGMGTMLVCVIVLFLLSWKKVVPYHERSMKLATNAECQYKSI